MAATQREAAPRQYLRPAGGRWMWCPVSPITGLRDTSMPMQALCGRRRRTVLPTASYSPDQPETKPPRMIRRWACATSSDDLIAKFVMAGLVVRPGDMGNTVRRHG